MNKDREILVSLPNVIQAEVSLNKGKGNVFMITDYLNFYMNLLHRILVFIFWLLFLSSK